MKNRVLRLTLVVILVIAMVLTVAACEQDPVVESPTPTPSTPTPQPPAPDTPTPPPVTPAPPVVVDKTADEFGISLEGFDGVYEAEYDKDNYGETFAYGYFLLKVDADKINDEDYGLVIKAGNTEILTTYSTSGSTVTYDGEINALADTIDFKAEYDFDTTEENDNRAVNKIPASQVDYDGDNKFATSGDLAELVMTEVLDEDGEVVKGEYIIGLPIAGEFALELEVIITDEFGNYGAWNIADKDREEFEFDLEAVATVAKAEKTITPDPITVEENKDAELLLVKADDKYTVNVDEGGDNDPVEYSVFSTFDNAKYVDVDNNETFQLVYDLAYVEETTVGEYAVAVTLEDANDKEVEMEDLEFKNYILSLADTKIYVVSAQDWEEIRDVATSISEINYSSSGTFNYADSNFKTQHPIAQERYDALSDAQKAFFKTGVVSSHGNSTGQFGPVNNMFGNCLYDWIIVAGVDGDYNGTAIAQNVVANLSAEALVDYLEDAKEAAIDAAAVDAFNDVVDDSGIPEDDAEPFTFNNENSEHISGFNKVDDYYNGLSDDDKDAIDEANSIQKQRYDNAKSKMDELGVNAVKELIVGAFNAYADALEEDTLIIYQDGEVSVNGNGDTQLNAAEDKAWAYINSAEVKTMTAQAQAAYDALSDDQQKAFEKVDAENGQDDRLLSVIDPDDATKYLSVIVVEDEKSEYLVALDKLTDMNEKIDEMVQVSEYINIEDYSGDEVAYQRLTNLVYGWNVAGDFDASASEDAVFGHMFRDDFEEYDDTTIDRFAMRDIIDAEPRKLEGIVAEYTAWIDYILEIEDFKAELVDTFEAGVSEFFDDNAEDYEGRTINIATSFDKDGSMAKTIIDAIKNETDVTVPGNLDTDAFVSNAANGYSTPDVKEDAFDLPDMTKFDTIEEVQEELTEIIDIDKVIDEYTDMFEEKD